MLLALLAGRSVVAGPHGTIDTSFSGTGRIILDLSFDAIVFPTDDAAKAVLVQPDGKIVVAGHTDRGASDFAVVRFTSDGALDTTFSGDGIARISFQGLDYATAIAQTLDGRTVVAGYTDNGLGGGVNDFAIAVLTAAGELDTTFDGDGRRTVDFGSDDQATAVVALENGEILVAGTAFGANSNFAVALLGANGALRPTFDGDGRATIDFGGAADAVSALAVDDASRIVIAGSSGGDAAVVRLGQAGGLDTSFDGDGRLSINLGSTDRATALALKPDGRIVMAGVGVTLPTQGWIIRLTENGAFDTSFSGDGRTTLTYATGAASTVQSIALLWNGKIAVAGSVQEGAVGDFVTSVLEADGSPDTTFDTDGMLRTDISGNGFDRAWGMAVQPDGALVVAGQTGAGAASPANFALLRVGADTPFDTTFDGDGRVFTDFATGGPASGVSLAPQPDGKTLVAGSAIGGDFQVMRLTAGGAIDTSFGAGGTRVVSFGGIDTPTAMVRDGFGRVIVVGYTTADAAGGTGDENLAVTRLTSAGTIDLSFNAIGTGGASIGNGRLIVELSTTENDRATAVALEPGGNRIVIAGTVGVAGGFAVVVLDSEGHPDPSFSGDGNTIVSLGTFDQATAIAVQADGKFLVAGRVTTGGVSKFGVVRLTAAGVVDTTFDGDGWAVVDFTSAAAAEALAVQADQRVVVAGTVQGANDFGVARLTSTGAPDTSFSGDGKTTIAFGAASGAPAESAKSLAVRTDGKLVIVGQSTAAAATVPWDIAVARLNADGGLDQTFADGGLLLIDAGGSEVGSATTIEPTTGKVVIAGTTSRGNKALIMRLAADPSGVPPALPTLSINDVTVTEGNAGTTNVNFMVSLSAPSNVPVTCRVQNANGSAVAPGDYSGASGAAVLVPGTTSVVIQTQVFGDVIDEPNETFTMVVSEVLGATLVKGVGIATILDDDVAVQITSPTSAASFTASQPLITIGGTAADVQGLQSVTWSSSNGMNGVATGTSPWTASVPLSAGANVVTVTAHGAGGYMATDTVTIDVAQFTAYLAEGATSNFLDTRFALLNPGAIDTTATMTFARVGTTNLVQAVPVPAHTRVTVNPKTIPGLEAAEFSTAVTSSQPVVVDRTMSWDATGYGAHAETALPAPSTTWYLAEGATHSGFDLFYLLQNPSALSTMVRVRYLRPSGAPLVKDYLLPPLSRTNIWVNVEDFPGQGLALAATDVSAEITSLDATPIIVERALYLTSQGRLFNAGHESAGVTAPALRWFLAEGATGPYFDLFVLIANPGTTDAQVTVTYLLTTGQTYARTLTAPANSRSNIWVDQESFDGGATFPLANVAVSTTVASQNNVPIIVERALWWPGDFSTWHEAHNSAGATQTGTVWALAEGEVAGPSVLSADETYILIANASAFAGTARVTLYFDDGTSTALDYPLAANSRTNVAVGPDFGAIVSGRKFGAVITSLGATPAQIVVERAMYRNAGGVPWAAGTNALATRLQ